MNGFCHTVSAPNGLIQEDYLAQLGRVNRLKRADHLCSSALKAVEGGQFEEVLSTLFNLGFISRSVLEKTLSMKGEKFLVASRMLLVRTISRFIGYSQFSPRYFTDFEIDLENEWLVYNDASPSYIDLCEINNVEVAQFMGAYLDQLLLRGLATSGDEFITTHWSPLGEYLDGLDSSGILDESPQEFVINLAEFYGYDESLLEDEDELQDFLQGVASHSGCDIEAPFDDEAIKALHQHLFNVSKTLRSKGSINESANIKSYLEKDFGEHHPRIERLVSILDELDELLPYIDFDGAGEADLLHWSTNLVYKKDLGMANTYVESSLDQAFDYISQVGEPATLRTKLDKGSRKRIKTLLGLYNEVQALLGELPKTTI